LDEFDVKGRGGVNFRIIKSSFKNILKIKPFNSFDGTSSRKKNVGFLLNLMCMIM